MYREHLLEKFRIKLRWFWGCCSILCNSTWWLWGNYFKR